MSGRKTDRKRRYHRKHENAMGCLDAIMGVFYWIIEKIAGKPKS